MFQNHSNCEDRLATELCYFDAFKLSSENVRQGARPLFKLPILKLDLLSCSSDTL